MAGTNWGQAGQGAAGGAMAGAAIGSIVPGVGTAIGAVGGGLLGGLAGLFGNNGAADYQTQLQQLAQQYAMRNPPKAQQSQFRGQQQTLISQLENLATGNGPSVAAQQMQVGQNQASAQEASAAAGAGGRGVNAGAALRQAMNTNAETNQSIVGQTGIARASEEMGAYQELGSTVNQAVQSDNQLNESNVQAYLSSIGLNQQGQMGALGMAMGSAGAGTGGAIMAGGASTMPLLAQYLKAQQGPGGLGGGGNGVPQIPITSPSQLGGV